ncbi:hypothetical protein D3C83_250520 [compost metagenome]
MLRRMTETPEWKADLATNHWTPHFVTGAALHKEVERENAELKALLAELGLAK